MNLQSCKGHNFGMENTFLLDRFTDSRLDVKGWYFVVSLDNVKKELACFYVEQF